MRNRSALPAALALLSAAACASAATPGAYPVRPVRVVGPFSPGGGSDLVARAVAQGLTERLGQQFIVDNRPGAGGTIGMDIAARAAPDGHTLAVVSGTLTATPHLRRKLPYDLVRDFAPITQATTQPYVVIVNPKVAATSVAELVALSKSAPSGLTYGSSGIGSIQHLIGVLLAERTGARLTHVPYKGGALVLSDVVGGQIDLGFINPLPAGPHIRAGRVRALAVTTAARSTALPDLPAVAELVPGFSVDNWYGFVAPARTPAALVARLNREIVAVLAVPALRDRLLREGSQIVASAPEAFGRHIAREIAEWGRLVRAAGIQPE
jgi:tripartite-type tricarboxylate transporter receptor subunit TctC